MTSPEPITFLNRLAFPRSPYEWDPSSCLRDGMDIGGGAVASERWQFDYAEVEMEDRCRAFVPNTQIVKRGTP